MGTFYSLKIAKILCSPDPLNFYIFMQHCSIHAVPLLYVRSRIASEENVPFLARLARKWGIFHARILHL